MARINNPFSPGRMVERLQETSWPSSLKNRSEPIYFVQTYPRLIMTYGGLLTSPFNALPTLNYCQRYRITARRCASCRKLLSKATRKLLLKHGKSILHSVTVARLLLSSCIRVLRVMSGVEHITQSPSW